MIHLKAHKPRIVIIGGGAGGLELVTRLGRTLGKKKKAEIILIDSDLTHIWKPLLHEVAAGNLHPSDNELNYLTHAYWNHYRFYLGRVDQIDREKKQISTTPTCDETGYAYIPRRVFEYDILIIAVGAETNDFGIHGVKENCFFLDYYQDADRLHQKILRSVYAADTRDEPLRPGQLHIAIVGAGATGIELSAELHEATREMANFGTNHIQPDKDIKIMIIEAADRILPGLPERLANQVGRQLDILAIQVLTGHQIVKADEHGLYIEGGAFIPAEIKIWTAGIKAPGFLASLKGLERNRQDQLIVRSSLQTTRDEAIFSFGDCAACPLPGSDQLVPPRAQAAHQQATMLYKSMRCLLDGRPLPEYTYVDHGSLINMSRYSTIGNLMGNLAGKISKTIFIEGIIARFMYLFLYKLHQFVIYGIHRTCLRSIANLLTRRTRTKTKLH